MRDLTKVRDMIRRHEGLSLKAYKCTAGKTTIGYGRNIESVGISKEEAELLLHNDIKKCLEFLEKYKWYNIMSEPRQDVCIDMVFNLGEQGFLAFKKFIIAIYNHDYDVASKEMLNSKWAMQVGKRAHELSEIMRAGEYP